MKWVFIFIFNFILVCLFFSQNDEDAIRYSRGAVSGSARSIAMAGAFGAMGADISCLNNNPAGIGVYKSSDISATGGFRFARVQSHYNDSSTSDFKNNFCLPNIGIAGAGVNKEIDKNNFTRSNFAVSINRITNFKNNISIAGKSKGSSLAQGFQSAAQGNIPQNLSEFYEFWPYYFDLIDTVNGINTLYSSTIPSTANNKQEFSAIEGGGLSEISMGGGYSWNDKIYGGFAVAIPTINYARSTIYKETCDIPYPTPNTAQKFSSFTYGEELVTKGKGINAKLGIIYRFSQYFRGGLSVQTPTVYAIKETYKSTFGFTYVGLQSIDTSASGSFRYTFFTPSKITGSISILFGKAGAINIDVETMSYANMQLKAPNQFLAINKLIRQTYKQAINFKIGLERNIKPIIIRAGYGMFGSPTGEIFSGKFVRQTISLGGGYKFKDVSIDFVYSQNLRKENYYLYNPLYVNAAAMRYNSGFFLCTLSKKI